MKLREDQILFMLSSKLKDLASELGIFIQSATQLNGQWEEAEEVNQNLLRGAKSIADYDEFLCWDNSIYLLASIFLLLCKI